MKQTIPTTYTLAELAKLTSTQLIGDPQHRISHVADLENAQSQDASFLMNHRYTAAMKDSKAGVVFIDPNVEPIPDRNFLISDNPSKSFQQVIELFHAAKDQDTGFNGIHPSAIVHPQALIGRDVSIAPYAVIAKGAKIGDRTTIGSGVYIGPHVCIGSNCTIHPHVVIREYCEIGNNVILQPGVIIGSCGFGYTTDARGHHTKLTQTGIVIIEDDVEIGANTTIDRGRFTPTRVARGSKIDNLVQIAHGVNIGEDNIIIAQTGIAGSSKTGKNVILAGQSGIVGHVNIADRVIIAAQSGVTKSIQEVGAKYIGAPALPVSEHHRQHAYLKKIEKYVKKISELEKRIQALEENKKE
jgi:UDP-3-O-[3-hydroxymyristoyl] glucosamine N-acyltransferase